MAVPYVLAVGAHYCACLFLSDQPSASSPKSLTAVLPSLRIRKHRLEACLKQGYIRCCRPHPYTHQLLGWACCVGLWTATHISKEPKGRLLWGKCCCPQAHHRVQATSPCQWQSSPATSSRYGSCHARSIALIWVGRHANNVLSIIYIVRHPSNDAFILYVKDTCFKGVPAPTSSPSKVSVTVSHCPKLPHSHEHNPSCMSA